MALSLSLSQLASIAVGAALVDVVDYRWLGTAAVLLLSGPAAHVLFTPAPVTAPYGGACPLIPAADATTSSSHCTR